MGVPVTPMKFGISPQPISAWRNGGLSVLCAIRVPVLESMTRTMFWFEAVMTISEPPGKVYVNGLAYHTSKGTVDWKLHCTPKLDPATTFGSMLWLGK